VAPAVAALAAFLGGWQGAPVVVEAIGRAARAASEINGVVVDVNKLCVATDPLIDALDDAHPKSRALAALAGAADRICAAAAHGPGIATDARLVGAALTAIGEARAKPRGAPESMGISNVPRPERTGR
jgi:hypothetical protein